MCIFIYLRSYLANYSFDFYHSSSTDSPWRLVSQPFAVAGSITPNRRQRSRSTLTSAKNARVSAPISISIIDRPRLIFQVPKRLEKPRLSRGGVTTFARPVIISRQRIVSLTSRRLVRKPLTLTMLQD